MHGTTNIKFYILITSRPCVFMVRTNRKFALNDFYNRGGERLLRGTSWVNNTDTFRLNPFAGSLALHSHTQLRSKTCVQANDQVVVNAHEGRFPSIYVLSLREVTSHVTPEFRGTQFGKYWHNVIAFLVVAWEKYECISQSLQRYKSRLIPVDCICCETVSQSQRSQAFYPHTVGKTLNRIKNLLRPVVIYKRSCTRQFYEARVNICGAANRDNNNNLPVTKIPCLVDHE